MSRTTTDATADDPEHPRAPHRHRWQLCMPHENIEPSGAAAVSEGAPWREGLAAAALNSRRAMRWHGVCSGARLAQTARADVVVAGAGACLVALYAHCERQCMCISMRVCRDGPDGLSGRMGSAWAGRRRTAAAHMSSTELCHICRTFVSLLCVTCADRRNVDMPSAVDHADV